MTGILVHKPLQSKIKMNMVSRTPTQTRRAAVILILLSALLIEPAVLRANPAFQFQFQDHSDIIIQNRIMRNMIKKNAAKRRREQAARNRGDYHYSASSHRTRRRHRRH